MYLYEEIRTFVKSGKLNEGIEFAEQRMKELGRSDFHSILGKDFFHLTRSLYKFLESNFADGDKLRQTKAFYTELNGFSINYDKWFLFVQAHDTREDYHDDTSDWLCDGFWGSHNPEYFVLKGLRRIRKAFGKYDKLQERSESLKKSATIAEYLVVMRLQQLFDVVISKGKQASRPWATIPWGVTAHDYFIIHVIE